MWIGRECRGGGDGHLNSGINQNRRVIILNLWCVRFGLLVGALVVVVGVACWPFCKVVVESSCGSVARIHVDFDCESKAVCFG
jgi:hypothetical protein